MKKLIALAVVAAIAIGALLMTGCAGVDATKLAVSLVVEDKFGDTSFADAAKPVGPILEQEYYIEAAEPVECGGLNVETKLKEAADTSDIVIFVGTGKDVDLAKLAAGYVDVRFIWIGCDQEPVSANATNLVCEAGQTADAIYRAIETYALGDGSMWGTSWTYNAASYDAMPTLAPTEAPTEAE